MSRVAAAIATLAVQDFRVGVRGVWARDSTFLQDCLVSGFALYTFCILQQAMLLQAILQGTLASDAWEADRFMTL